MHALSIFAKAALACLCLGIFPVKAHEDDAVFAELKTETPRMRTTAGSIALNNDLHSVAALARLAEGQGARNFIFGFVEFDWDSRSSASLPGFERWSVDRINGEPSK